MKKVIFTLFAFCAFYAVDAQKCTNPGSGSSQCSPDGSMTKPGLKPTTDSLPTVVNGQTVTTVIQFRNFDTVTAFGNTLTVHTLKVDSINGLPSGLCWATDRADDTYCNGAGNPAVTDCPVGMPGEGCIKINGSTCSDPGVYRLKIKVLVDVGLGFAVPYDADDVGLKYYVRVKNDGDSDVLLDTSQTATFTKPAGYSATAVCTTSTIGDFDITMSTLNIVPNPFNGVAKVLFTSSKAGVYTERITNMIGSEVYRNEMEVKSGVNFSSIDRSNLSGGVYFYSLTDGKNTITKRIVVSE